MAIAVPVAMPAETGSQQGASSFFEEYREMATFSMAGLGLKVPDQRLPEKTERCDATPAKNLRQSSSYDWCVLPSGAVPVCRVMAANSSWGRTGLLT